jgi:hypothetical protein
MVHAHGDTAERRDLEHGKGQVKLADGESGVLAFVSLAEIIELKDVLRARARRRERALTERCVEILEECLADARVAYHWAPVRERLVRAGKIRQLEELITYTAEFS